MRNLRQSRDVKDEAKSSRTRVAPWFLLGVAAIASSWVVLRLLIALSGFHPLYPGSAILTMVMVAIAVAAGGAGLPAFRRHRRRGLDTKEEAPTGSRRGQFWLWLAAGPVVAFWIVLWLMMEFAPSPPAVFVHRIFTGIVGGLGALGIGLYFVTFVGSRKRSQDSPGLGKRVKNNGQDKDRDRQGGDAGDAQ